MRDPKSGPSPDWRAPASGRLRRSPTPVNLFRFKLQDLKPPSDEFSSGEWLLLLWSTTSDMPAQLKTEPSAQ